MQQSLLSDRLIISMPEGTEEQSVHFGGLMGGIVGGETEINLILFGNGQTLTVNVSELYMYSTGDSKKDVQLFIDSIHADSYNTLDNTSLEPIQINDTITVIQPIVIDAYDSDFIMGALVRAIDDTLMAVKVYADKKAMTYPEDCKSLAMQIIGSVGVGTRSLDVDGMKLDIGDYTIQVAPGYVPFIRDSYHYVWHFSKLVAIGDTQSSFGLYRDNYLSYDDSKNPIITVEDTVLGRTITWRLFTNIPGTFDEESYAEVIIGTGADGWAKYMHIYAYPSSESDWEAIRGMVRSLNREDDISSEIVRDTEYRLNNEDGEPPPDKWLFYGLIIVVVALIVLLVIRKRRKCSKLTKD